MSGDYVCKPDGTLAMSLNWSANFGIQNAKALLLQNLKVINKKFTDVNNSVKSGKFRTVQVRKKNQAGYQRDLNEMK